MQGAPRVPGLPRNATNSIADASRPDKRQPAGYPISLKPFVWDRAMARSELADFDAFLTQHPEFGERSHALPFFHSRPHLCGFLGLCVGSLAKPDAIAFELSLSGNYRPDFVVGCTQTRSALFVELEDGKKGSFFSRPGTRKAKLAPTVLSAVSQIVDWSFQLTQLNDAGYQALLGFRPKTLSFLVICGRKSLALNPIERLRYDWVANSVSVDERPVQIQTYDDVEQLVRMHAGPYGF